MFAKFSKKIPNWTILLNLLLQFFIYKKILDFIKCSFFLDFPRSKKKSEIKKTFLVSKAVFVF